MTNSMDFLTGINIIYKYTTKNTSINIIENSSIIIHGLKLISSYDDLSSLGFCGWDIGKENVDNSWARFDELERIDV